MSEPDQLRETLDRAHRVRSIIEDPLYIEARAKIRQALIDEWIKCEVGDSFKKEKLHLMVTVADQFHALFEETLNSGIIAAASLRYLEEERQRQELVGYNRRR